MNRNGTPGPASPTSSVDSALAHAHRAYASVSLPDGDTLMLDPVTWQPFAVLVPWGRYAAGRMVVPDRVRVGPGFPGPTPARPAAPPTCNLDAGQRDLPRRVPVRGRSNLTPEQADYIRTLAATTRYSTSRIVAEFAKKFGKRIHRNTAARYAREVKATAGPGAKKAGASS